MVLEDAIKSKLLADIKSDQWYIRRSALNMVPAVVSLYTSSESELFKGAYLPHVFLEMLFTHQSP